MLFRTFYNACSTSTSKSKHPKSAEVIKSVNLLFSTLEPQYVWTHCGYLFGKACEFDKGSKRSKYRRSKLSAEQADSLIKPVGSGFPELQEVCELTAFLLESVSLDAFIDTPSEHLPRYFI